MNRCPEAASTQHSLPLPALPAGLSCGGTPDLSPLLNCQGQAQQCQEVDSEALPIASADCDLVLLTGQEHLCSSLFLPDVSAEDTAYFPSFLSCPLYLKSFWALQNDRKSRVRKPCKLAPRLSHAVCLPALSFALPSMSVFLRQKTDI